MVNSQVEQLQKLVTSQGPERADAIVWLHGNMYDRGEKVMELYQAGYAPLIVITCNNERVVEDDRVHVKDIVAWLIEHGIDREAILVDDKSMNTHDQAVHIIEMAKVHNWRTILLVGSTHHQLRAFLTFLRQARIQSWSGRIINQPAHIDWDAKPSGRRKTTGEAFRDELIKLEAYKGDIAAVEEGLKYFTTI